MTPTSNRSSIDAQKREPPFVSSFKKLNAQVAFTVLVVNSVECSFVIHKPLLKAR
jgi:hypothetical protein